MRLPLLGSMFIRWAIPMFALPLVLQGCSSQALKNSDAGPVDERRTKVDLHPTRKIDMLFMIDNSAGMGPIQRKLAAALPQFINSLRDDTATIPLPDMRMAIITSDVGAGKSSVCTPPYGDRGIPQMKGSCGQHVGARWLANEPNIPAAKNYDGDDLAKVFGCLVESVGQSGCEFEQQLQSIQFAFVADQGDGVAVKDLVRDDAYLFVFLVTDEDDCSMPLNSLLAAPDLSQTEAWSLRCATRGHMCSGANLEYPTTAPFLSDYSLCQARTDYCDEKEPAENPTTCTPLADIRKIASTIKSYKLDHGGRDDMILAAAIFGKPRTGQTSTTYKIDTVPNPVAGQADVFGLWPICSDPTASGTTGNDPTYASAIMPGFAGLRIQAFLDQFPKYRSLGFSVCEADYNQAMSQIGEALRTKLSSSCIPQKLMDVDPFLDGVQPDCTVQEVRNGSVIAPGLPWCGDTNEWPCWRVENNPIACPAQDGLPSQNFVVKQAPETQQDPTQTFTVACRTCALLKPGVDSGTNVPEGCAY